jgi:hypothetical protein
VALQEVKEKKTRLTKELRALVWELRQKYPRYAALHYPEPLPARDLHLQEGEVLLEYALGETSNYVFVIRRGGVRKIFRMPLGREELEAKVRAFMEPFTQRRSDKFSPAQGKGLADLLLAGVLPEIKESDRVIIIPDGILGLLPFEALVLKEGKGSEDSSFVGDKYSLTYYQSAAVLALKRRLKKEQASRPLFALGHPVFSERDPRCQSGPPRTQTLAMKAEDNATYAFRGLATHRDWGKTTHSSPTGEELVFSAPARYRERYPGHRRAPGGQARPPGYPLVPAGQ